MFTGIVEELGTIRSMDLAHPQESLRIAAHHVLEDLKQGDSIAVNGVCLTVTSYDDRSFAVGVMPETLRRSSLGALEIGSTVNLERPVQPQTRLGGHFVQGHVDGVGMVESVQPDGNALAVRIETSPEILRYVVEKGFIAVEGASLTVTEIDDRGFGVALVPYTQEHVAKSLFTPGHQVNLEVDVLAKYVEKLVVH